MKEWQKGFELEVLRRPARLFKEAYKWYSFGAFGIPNERDVATAMEKGTYYEVPVQGRKGVFIGGQVSSHGRHKDFTGREVRIPSGDFFIHELAVPASVDWSSDLDFTVKRIREVASEKGSLCVWMEVHQENSELLSVLASHGFVYVCTKIMSSSDLKSLYVVGSPEDVARRTLPPLPPEETAALTCLDEDFLSLEDQQTVLGELSRYIRHTGVGAWGQHYSSYNKKDSWSAFALYGYVPSQPAFIIKPDEMAKKWKAENPDLMNARIAPTIAAPYFISTLSLLDRVPGEKNRVRFMRVAGKGELGRHADITNRDSGVKDGALARLHIPLKTSIDCLFYAWDQKGVKLDRHLGERSLFYLDQRKPHAVRNSAKEDRIHLVMDVASSPGLREMIVNGK